MISHAYHDVEKIVVSPVEPLGGEGSASKTMSSDITIHLKSGETVMLNFFSNEKNKLALLIEK